MARNSYDLEGELEDEFEEELEGDGEEFLGGAARAVDGLLGEEELELEGELEDEFEASVGGTVRTAGFLPPVVGREYEDEDEAEEFFRKIRRASTRPGRSWDHWPRP